MASRERFVETIHHRGSQGIVFDLGATKASGFSVSLLYRLRKAHGKDEPVKVHDTFQMIGLVDEKDAEMFGIDVLGIWSDAGIDCHNLQDNYDLANVEKVFEVVKDYK